MRSSFPGFSPDALAFLRSLKRNNRREWFQPRKEKYDKLIKAPMLELVNALNEELAQFAPEYVTPPQKAVYRIYRDTRFAKDKTPYKTHVSAIFPRHTAVKREGSVFYFHFTEKELLFFGGVYSPEREELLQYRALLRDHTKNFRPFLKTPKLKKARWADCRESSSAACPKAFPWTIRQKNFCGTASGIWKPPST